MLMSLANEIGSIFYDAFVVKFDFWLLFGVTAQLLFAGRFLVQWISSERAGRSVVPVAFWFFSMAGGLMTLTYGIVKREPVIIVGQAFSTIIYMRNLMLIVKERKQSQAGDTPAA